MYKIRILSTLCLIVLFPRTVLAISPPLLADPENGSTVTKSTLSWEAVEGNLQYKIFLDDEPTITSPYLKPAYYTEKTTYSPQLNLGTYYWKVGAQDPTDKSWAFSEIRSFTLAEAPTETPTPTPAPPTTTPTNEPPTPTKTPTPAKTPTPTKSIATLTPTPTKPALTPTKTSSSPSPTSANQNSSNLPASILGTSSAQPTTTPQIKSSVFTFQNLSLVSGGIILILSGIFLLTFIAKGRFKS